MLFYPVIKIRYNDTPGLSVCPLTHQDFQVGIWQVKNCPTDVGNLRRTRPRFSYAFEGLRNQLEFPQFPHYSKTIKRLRKIYHPLAANQVPHHLHPDSSLQRPSYSPSKVWESNTSEPAKTWTLPKSWTGELWWSVFGMCLKMSQEFQSELDFNTKIWWLDPLIGLQPCISGGAVSKIMSIGALPSPMICRIRKHLPQHPVCRAIGILSECGMDISIWLSVARLCTFV